MKNTEKHIKTLEEWRNCPMSNFICTVGIETKLETNMPRGKMLLLSLINSGVREFDEQSVNRIFECCLCGLCTQCGFDDTDIPSAIAAGRADINEAGLLPKKVKEFAKTIREDCIWESADISKLKNKPVVFITSDQGNAAAFEKIAGKAGIEATVIVEGKYDSAILYELGIWDISKKYTDKITELTDDENIKSVVIDSPHLWERLKHNKKIIAVTEYIKYLIDNGKLKLKDAKIKNITYHDPCRLVRNAKDETTVRSIFNSAKVELKELRWNKKDAKCCGGPSLKICAPELSKKITERRIGQIKDINAEKVIVSCSHCFSNFKESKPDLKVEKILDFILGLAK